MSLFNADNDLYLEGRLVSGILRSENVIFYHPLDDSVEYTQNQSWSGYGGFVNGKIGLAESAITADVATWEDIETVSGMNDAMGGRGPVIKIDSTTAVIVYKDDSSSVIGRVATVSGTDLILGNASDSSGVQAGTVGFPDGAHFGSGKFVIGWRGSSNKFYLQAGEVSGTNITWGSLYNPFNVAWSIGGITSLNETSGVLIYGTFSPTTDIFARVIILSGLDVTVGSATQLSISDGAMSASVTTLDSTRVVVAFSDGPSTRGDTVILTVSGTDITSGAVTTFASGNMNVPGALDVISLDSGTMAYSYQISSTSRTKIATISGDIFTFGDGEVVDTNIIHGGLGKLSSTRYIVCGTNDTFGRNAKICTISGLNISVGANAATTVSDNGGGATETLSETNFLHMSIGDLALGQIVNNEAQLIASIPEVYPMATNNDRVTIALWSKKLTSESSKITVQRDYTVEMTATTIALGPTPATWSGSGISSIMTTMNNGEDHLLVMDFENISSGNWILNTSIDGGSWISQSGQTSGTQSISPSGADPKLLIEDGEPGQWVDELVMWVGDKSVFEQFTDNELQNLYALADTFDDPMNEYEASLPSPIELSGSLYIQGNKNSVASGDLFTYGRNNTSGSIPLFVFAPPPDLYNIRVLYINGPNSMIASGDLFIGGFDSSVALARPFDWLINSVDYNPQIIGTLEGASGVNIQVWDVTNGQNTLVSIVSSGCYQIGNTSRWGWSTENMPVAQEYGQHYFYRMTSNIDEVFDGQFILDIPEGAKWIHPNDQSKYIR